MLIKSKKDFEKLDGFNKGWIVYMRGAWKEEPHVPRTYKPTSEEKEEYKRGANAAMIDTMDSNG